MFAAQLPSTVTSVISAYRPVVRTNGILSRTIKVPVFQPHVTRNRQSVRATMNVGDKKTVVESPNASSSTSTRGIDARAVIKIRKKMKETIIEKIEDQWESFFNGISHSFLIQIVSEDIDPVTNSGKRADSSVRSWLPKPSDHPDLIEYAANFTVPYDFGCPGAIVITNFNSKEFYLMEIVVHGLNEGPILFPAKTWIHSRKDNAESRIIFKNHTYLPSQTPPGLKDLRCEDLVSLRGNGKGERKPHDRIYDYDFHNDLANPDKGGQFTRLVLGGDARPCPRRCRTGRPPAKSDPSFESPVEKQQTPYVPRDEKYEENRKDAISAGKFKAIFQNLIPSMNAALARTDVPFTSFSEIDKLYSDGVILKDEDQKVVENQSLGNLIKLVFTVGERLLKFDIPAFLRRDKSVWLEDSEFGRQTLAGVNPVCIELLKELPIVSKLDTKVYGPPESAITKEIIEQGLNGMSVEEAIEKKRLFILDYHDILLPFVEKINSVPGRQIYASRAVFFYTPTGVLSPIVIELSLPLTSSSPHNKRIFTPGQDSTKQWIWKHAKAHVCSNDVNIHGVVSHWLRTHGCVEPYIISTHRQLSSMHPIFKLLHPHMRYTLEVNAYARLRFINEGGFIESGYSLGRYAGEVASAAYKNIWRFDMEALPANLIGRGMAVEDPSIPGGVKLVIEDYPYAADGLLIWSAIKELVESYVDHYYSDSNSITSDDELQSWWYEIKNKGHVDRRNEPWWPKLNTKEDLSSILTIIIWVATGQHAVVNFAQYPLGAYTPWRPTLMRKLIPKEDDLDYEKILHDPQHHFLSSLPTKLQATKMMAVQQNVSTHFPDEEYLVQMRLLHDRTINDPEVQKLFEKFSTRLEEIEETITGRNNDINLKHRCGAGIAPYELLLPSSGPGITGRGIPSSVSM